MLATTLLALVAGGCAQTPAPDAGGECRSERVVDRSGAEIEAEICDGELSMDEPLPYGIVDAIEALPAGAGRTALTDLNAALDRSLEVCDDFGSCSWYRRTERSTVTIDVVRLDDRGFPDTWRGTGRGTVSGR